MTHPDPIDLTSLSPSDLLFQALIDLRRCELDPEYTVKMFSWHTPPSVTGQSTCWVCLAGSVMAKSLGVLKTAFSGPMRFDLPTGNALTALDQFRVGKIRFGLSMLGHNPVPSHIRDRTITPYGTSPKKFKMDMADLHIYLRQKGY